MEEKEEEKEEEGKGNRLRSRMMMKRRKNREQSVKYISETRVVPRMCVFLFIFFWSMLMRLDLI